VENRDGGREEVRTIYPSKYHRTITAS